jgi:hypothetical protein
MRTVVITVVIGVAVAAVLLGALLLSSRPVGWGDQAFDQRQWKAAKSWEADNPRGKMVRSLMRAHDLRGMTRDQVIALLGPPDGVDKRIEDNLSVSGADAAAAGEFEYLLGAYSGYRVDFDFLAIRFDKRGRVRAWGLWQS